MAGRDNAGAIDITEGGGSELAPRGVTRIRRQGGVLQQSTDGAAYTGLTGGGATGYNALLATSDQVKVSGLDGANDGDYLGYFELKIAAATGTVKFQINDADTALYAGWVELTGAATVQGSRSSGTVEVCPSQTSVGDVISGFIKLRSSSPGARCFGSIELFMPAGPTLSFRGFVYDSATNITSVRFLGANANCFAIGSYVQMQRLGRTYG